MPGRQRRPSRSIRSVAAATRSLMATMPDLAQTRSPASAATRFTTGTDSGRYRRRQRAARLAAGDAPGRDRRRDRGAGNEAIEAQRSAGAAIIDKAWQRLGDDREADAESRQQHRSEKRRSVARRTRIDPAPQACRRLLPLGTSDPGRVSLVTGCPRGRDGAEASSSEVEFLRREVDQASRSAM